MIPNTGTFTSEQVRSVFSLTIPMTSAQIAAKIGVAGVWTSNDLRGKSGVTVTISVDSRELFTRNDGWDEWYRMADTFTVTVTGSTITSRTWSVIGGGHYDYATNPTNSNTFTVESPEYLYGGQSGPYYRAQCVVVTPAGTFTATSA